ncbi:hypothetical protein [Pedobacter sp. GR22-6]|uniref:hypothetical protein n=1 Tax=Pedobacter sp. GR22-6 TaxID=3127957 RepID=UPI00307E8226
MEDNPQIAKKAALFQALANKLTDGGNLIFGACSVGAGQAGIDFGSNMNKLVGGRINLFFAKQTVQPRYYADPSSGQRGPWFSRMFTEKFLHILPNGSQIQDRTITLNAVVGSPPVTLNKVK